MKNQYVDLKAGERLLVRDNHRLEAVLDVDEINKSGIKIRAHNTHQGFVRQSAKGDYFILCTGVKVYNFGNRSRGQRVHLRLEMQSKLEYKVDK